MTLTKDSAVRVRHFLVVAVAVLVCGACGLGGNGTQVRGTSSEASTSMTAFEDRTFDTWHVGDDSGRSTSEVTGVLKQSDGCSEVEIDGKRHAVTWPPATSRSAEGISVGGHLYRFDEPSKFEVIKGYDGEQRPVSCVTATAWLVVR